MNVAVLTKAIAAAPKGDWAEFGVAEGHSAKLLLRNLPDQGTRLWLFDSFKGLPEEWDEYHPKGHFACRRPGFEDERIVFVEGLFQETLPSWRPEVPLALVHIDCDLYSSATAVLRSLTDKLAPGAILVFDEILGSPLCFQNEGRALIEWLVEEARGVPIQAIARSEESAAWRVG